ncbi:MAG TPA: outer membrane protein assembly factor BamE, partial [Accumulibacter sp.]|nr:outer membrane protein assembly factor BamE [Accumulibacter sp.]HND80208.1 outer membrane protein assembly factor BamE [Accumulibacter sp.]
PWLATTGVAKFFSYDIPIGKVSSSVSPSAQGPYGAASAISHPPCHHFLLNEHMIDSRLLVFAAALSVLAGCSSVPRIVNEYRIDIQQGNVLTQEMVSQLRPGLSRDQVRFILGSPMLTDMFHADRWDYAYWLKKGSGEPVESRRFSVFFDTEGKLSKVTGDVAPATSKEPMVISETRNRELAISELADDGTTTPPESGPGFFQRLMESVGF